MHSRLIPLFIIAILPFACSFNFFGFKKKRDHIVIADEINAKVAKTLCKRHQMFQISEGGGMMGSVYMVGLGFTIPHLLSEEEARARLVDCAEEMLTAFNTNEEIRPYLKNYPFTTKNLQIVIFATTPTGGDVFDPHIGSVSIYESDNIVYRTEEPNTFVYKKTWREPYSEALKRVKEKSSSIPIRELPHSSPKK